MPARTARVMPTAKAGTLKAMVTEEAMEFACVALPMKPSAIIRAERIKYLDKVRILFTQK